MSQREGGCPRSRKCSTSTSLSKALKWGAAFAKIRGSKAALGPLQLRPQVLRRLLRWSARQDGDATWRHAGVRGSLEAIGRVCTPSFDTAAALQAQKAAEQPAQGKGSGVEPA